MAPAPPLESTSAYMYCIQNPLLQKFRIRHSEIPINFVGKCDICRDLIFVLLSVAENYSGRPTSWEKPATSGPLEVITISDSEDEAGPEVKSASATEIPSGQTSGCPSVMTLTPGGAPPPPDSADELSRGPVSNVSTPREPASSVEGKTPVKVEPVTTPGMSQKKRLLAKAHSEWILVEPKTEEGTERDLKGSRYNSYEYLDRARESRYENEMRERMRLDREREERARVDREQREERVRLERERDERVRVERERERERDERIQRERLERDERIQRERLERERMERAEFDYQAAALAARERDLRELAGVVPRLELAPPLAHQADYGDVHRGVEYIQPPAAHTNRDLLAVHRSSQHFNSPVHDSLYAPATVYVTAAGYQQITFPPPAHHARPVLPPPMQSAAVFQHPPLHPQYGYAPLSPGKTRYLY